MMALATSVVLACIVWATVEVVKTLRTHRRWLAETGAMVEGPDPIRLEARRHLAQGMTSRKVMQTKFKPPKGNCWAACVASVLEMPLSEMPDVEFESTEGMPGDEDVKRFWKKWREWLAERNLGLQRMTLGEGHPFPPGILIVTGQSPRGPWQHSVVYRDGELAHDPHPEGGGVLKVETIDLLYPLDPTLVWRLPLR